MIRTNVYVPHGEGVNIFSVVSFGLFLFSSVESLKSIICVAVGCEIC